jgi:hypothetical protein
MAFIKQSVIPQPRQVKNKIIWLATFALFLFSTFFVKPEKLTFTKCLFRELTGLSCPTCGLSRSLYLASHIKFWESVRLHIMGPIIYLIVLLLFLKFSFEIFSRKELQLIIRPVVVKMMIAVFASFWLGFWIFRLVSEISG